MVRLGFWGDSLNNLFEHKMTHLLGCRAWLGTQMSRLSKWGTCHGKGRWKAHTQPGFRLKTESSEGFWVCSACFRTASRGTRRGHSGRRTEPWFEPGPLYPPATDIHHLLSTGGLREQAPLCLSVSAPLRALCRGLGTWWLMLHVYLPPSQLALDYGIKFMETSAKANINVENVSPGPTAPAH